MCSSLRKLKKIKRRYENQLLAKKNVAGCSVGLKEVDQQYTDTYCIVAYVCPKTDVDQNNLIPPRLGGIQTDVQEMKPYIGGLGITSVAPYTYNLTNHEEECLEVQKMASLEMKLYNKVDFAISTFVTVDQLREAAQQSGLFIEELESQLESSPRAEPTPGVSIGRYQTSIESVFPGASVFMRTLITLQKSQVKKRKLSNRLKRILRKRYEYVPSEISGLGNVKGLAKPELGMTVSKSGRTTGVTDGKVVGIDASLYVDYPIGASLGRSRPDFGQPIFSPSPVDGGRFPSDIISYLSGYVPIRFPIEERPNLCNGFLPSVKRALFVEQIVTTARILQGDSGAPLVTDDLKYMGMSFAGSANLSFFNTYRNLARSLEKDMVKVDP